MKKSLAITLACLLLAALSPSLAFGRTADIIVSQDGSGDFSSVQDAIDAAPDYEHGYFTIILIKSGTYRERVTVPHNKTRLIIRGEGAGKTRIVYGLSAKMKWPGTDRNVGTSGSATMYIHANNIVVEDLTVENDAGEGKEIGQAVAVSINGDRVFFHRVSFIGNQDTLYTHGQYCRNGWAARNYFLNCYVEGTTDFIFGPATAMFENCEIRSKKDSYITAASTLKEFRHGYVFRNCRFTAGEGVTKCYLGRPWGAYAKTIIIGCELGSHILPEGWHDWEKEGKPDTKKNSYYAEYGNSGPGASLSGRVKWSHKLTARKAARYTFENVMLDPHDSDIWDPLNIQ